MELALHAAIGAALKVEPIQMRIVCANIRFRDKIDMLRTLVDVSSLSDEEKHQAKVKLRKLGRQGSRRNMVAHDPFVSDTQSKGVKFLTTQAKGEYGTTDVVWPLLRFQQEQRALQGHADFLDCLEQRFKRKPLTHQNYVDALRPFLDWNMGLDWKPVNSPPPSERTTGPNPANSLSQLDQVHPDSGLTNSKKIAQTPDKREEE
jgi:hypothetical protein